MSQELTTSLQKPAIISTFNTLQNGIKGDALAMKVKMFFAGLLVKELSEIFRAEVGETRGGDRKSDTSKIKGDTDVTFDDTSLKNYLEEAFGVTYRTCNRYLNFWERTTNSDKHAQAVAALNKVWSHHVESLRLEGPKKGGKPTQTLALQEAGMTLAGDVQELLSEADDLGLHELFELPIKDVTPEPEEETPETAADKKQKLIKFWCGDLMKRLGNNEFLRLPKPQLETLTTELEEALAKAKERLKTAKGKGKA